MPKQLFAGSVLNVHAPDSVGWVIAGVGSNGIAFAKKGSEKNETYGAQAVVFEMPATTTGEELVEFVVKRIATMNPPPRYRETESGYQYTEDRGYPCVNVQVTLDDTAAMTPSGSMLLKLQVIAIYCRHPGQQGLGFFAAYSRRGENTINDLQVGARSYIESVHVPK